MGCGFVFLLVDTVIVWGFLLAFVAGGTPRIPGHTVVGHALEWRGFMNDVKHSGYNGNGSGIFGFIAVEALCYSVGTTYIPRMYCAEPHVLGMSTVQLLFVLL